MKKRTLITFLGRAGSTKNRNRNEYEEVDYHFPPNQTIRSGYFGSALTRSGRYEIDQVFIIGTRTSMWDYLIQEGDDDLQLEVMESVDQTEGVTNDQLNKIALELQKLWKIPQITCQGVARQLSEERSFEEFQQFNLLLDRVCPKNQLLLDFTHSFRWMPLLFLSSLQYKASLGGRISFERMELIYGELRRNTPSLAIEFGDIWEGIKTAKAASHLFKKFDGEEISTILNPFWPEGAEAIKNLTAMIQFNLLTRLKGSGKKLNKAFQNPPTNPPQWFDSFFLALKSWSILFLTGNRAEQLLGLASVLAENKFFAQGYLALDEAVIELIPQASTLKELEQIKEAKKKLMEKLSPQLRQSLKEIQYIRNSIAHSGREITNYNQKQWDIPAQMENTWQKYQQAVEQAITKINRD